MSRQIEVDDEVYIIKDDENEGLYAIVKHIQPDGTLVVMIPGASANEYDYAPEDVELNELQ